MNELGLIKALLGDNPIEGIIRACEAIDGYYARQRYDDNARIMLENAFRLYERGEMTKDQLKAIIDLLPQPCLTVRGR
jgi:hypothetical protein